MKKGILSLITILLVSILSAQDYNYQFRLSLKDKGKTSYTTDKPQDFLSEKAIERRKKHNIAINRTDLPISDDYLRTIEETGGKVIAKSKWLNTVTVHCTDSTMVNLFSALPFVYDTQFVWRGKPDSIHNNKTDTVAIYPIKENIDLDNYYGKAFDNIRLNNGQALHNAGFKGDGIDIAVIDAGFNNLPKIEMLDNIHIKGQKGFVYQKEDLFGSSANAHGLMVLSCIAANKPNQLVGTAPEANFWILSSEDTRSEFPVEEDYWVAAVEYADSIGVDVINTSLGYAEFDKPAQSYTKAELNGRSNFITRGANAAANKGLLIVCSAGNSGDSPWRSITSPADAPNILTVGAIQQDSIISPFSSRGLTADGRIKPDVVALGSLSAVVNNKGLVSQNYGTSFSSPIMCGMAACLWQAFPTLTNKEIINVIRQSANRYDFPDADYGYGIPDMGKAMEIAQKVLEKKALSKDKNK